ncbi:TIGR02444 family protein [Bosea sp. TAB14]|jgi:uncharacterized protein (TIGR02444 family)|uniref:TIGR02444 family protein n=1 Tax=Bosea sp. TAB14 TaxID=3237481 RepID=UPI003F912590
MMDEAEADRAFDLDSPFWRFALRVYAEPGVCELCLTLQDENGVDVNLLLFACWCGRTGRRLTLQHVETAAASTVAWTEGVVRHLRAARRAWKLFGPDEPQAWAGRESLKSVELLSERIVCATLYGMADRFGIVREAEPLRAGVIGANLHLVLQRAGVPAGRIETASCALVEACRAAG